MSTVETIMTPHRSRLCHFVIDCDNLDRAVEFWSAALDATEEPVSEQSRDIYRRLRLPDSDIRVLLQHTKDEKIAKERMNLDLETNNVEAEVRRLEALGATRWDHQQVRGYDFWVIRDPWGNEFVFYGQSSQNCLPGVGHGERNWVRFRKPHPRLTENPGERRRLPTTNKCAW